MKIFFINTCLLFFSMMLFAQEGINFDKGTWKKVLAKAKQENKLVFVDVYTSWCGPCKKMAAKVFPKKEVGDVFNAEFVNYQIDAEKGEGIQIAKEFSVKSYPTYLFVNGDGSLVYRSGGYNEAGKFLQEAAIAIKEKNDPTPFAKWEDEYNSGKRSKGFLMGYLKKRAVIKMPSAELIDMVFPMLIPTDLSNLDFLSSMIHYDPNIEYVPNGNLYNYILGHHKEIDAVLSKKDDFSLNILDVGIRQYFKKSIISQNKKKMLPVMVEANKKLMTLLKKDDKDINITSKELVMSFYSGTKNAKKLIPAAIDYVNNGLMKLDIKGKIAADRADYQNFMTPYLSGTEDSTKVEHWEMMKNLKSAQRMINPTYELRSAAETFYLNVDDKKILGQAMEWTKRAESWFPHFSTKAVYAGLLFKTGNKTDAIDLMEKLSEDPIVQGNPGLHELVLDNVEKMKKNEAPINLWHL